MTLQQINELLRPYEALNLFMDAWLVLAVESPAVVQRWRLQAEQQMRAAGRGGLTDEQVLFFLCFVSDFKFKSRLYRIQLTMKIFLTDNLRI